MRNVKVTGETERLARMLDKYPALKENAKRVHEMLTRFKDLSPEGKQTVINEFKDKYPDVVKILTGEE